MHLRARISSTISSFRNTKFPQSYRLFIIIVQLDSILGNSILRGKKINCTSIERKETTSGICFIIPSAGPFVGDTTFTYNFNATVLPIRYVEENKWPSIYLWPYLGIPCKSRQWPHMVRTSAQGSKQLRHGIV